MIKLNIITALFLMILIGCESTVPGPQGVAGQDGLDGLDGLDGEESYVFEYEVNFFAPEYSALLELPDNFTMLDSDVMVAYLLWEVLADDTEVWRPVPQSLFFTDGILHYNFDFSKFDATIFLDGTVNLDGLGSDYTDNWIVRVVVIPAQFVNGRSIMDYTNYEEVKELMNLPPSELATPDYQKRPE